jgi:hypothetical protein
MFLIADNKAFVKCGNVYCAWYNLFISQFSRKLIESTCCLLCRIRIHYCKHLFALSDVVTYGFTFNRLIAKRHLQGSPAVIIYGTHLQLDMHMNA